MATTKLMTAEDLFEMGSDSGYELIRGELIEMSPANHRSSEMAARLIYKLGSLVYEQELGHLSGADGGFLISRNPDTVVAPDVAFVRRDRLPPVEQQIAFLELAPDLAIEVLSPSDRYTDVNDKVMLYLRSGVGLVWIVDPARRTITTFSSQHPPRVFTTDDTIDGGDILPGLSLPVAGIFG